MWKILLAAVLAASTIGPAAAEVPAKKLFGAKRDGAKLAPAVYGSYAKGCVAGAEKLADDGPTWQAMRLSRNRHWAHPNTIELVKRLSRDGRKHGWNGLLVGDLTQPRGGPMLTGHASHQAGLDADIWLTPMPDRRLSSKEREELSATSMLARTKEGKLTNQRLSPERFTRKHAKIIETAARYNEVERIFVHPTIKRELCRQNPTKPAWLRKVRSQFGHHYHFHIRLGCPAGSPGCRPQAKVPSYGCETESFDYWFKVAYGPPRKPKPGAKPVKRKPKRQITLNRLPKQCRAVLTSAGTQGTAPVSVAALTAQVAPAAPKPLGANVAVPTFRPTGLLAPAPTEAL